MEIKKELAQALLELDVGDDTTDWEDDWFEGSDRVKFSLVHAKLADTSRWSHIWERVYKDLSADKYWLTTYRVGATECQDERAYENDGPQIELTEVVPVEVKKTIYKVVK